MDDWLGMLSAARGSTSDTSLDTYTDLHLGFTAIHPYADGNGRLARLLANIPVIEGGDPPVLVPQEGRRDYLMHMGDWSIARGAPRPGQPLVPRSESRARLQALFATVSRTARDLVAIYRERQAARGRQTR